MTKQEQKTKATEISVDDFINSIANEPQRADVRSIAAMMERVSRHPPRMWGAAIIGFGQYHYRYTSGREGDSARISFSPRKANIVIYLADGFDGYTALAPSLGKHKAGRSCLYISRLTDIDQQILEQLCAQSLAWTQAQYPEI